MSSAPIADLIAALEADVDLTPDAIETAVEYLLHPEGNQGLKADFLKALGQKGETDSEIAGFARAFLDRAVDPALDPKTMPGPLLDCCGTGGDKLDLFNVSTASMFVMAAGGICVVKHGNRSITSKCGGADVLESLGVRIDLPPADFKRCVQEVGCGFMFAPYYHPAFKEIAPVRKALGAQGVATIFNLLGPILNPARPDYQLVGVFLKSALLKFAGVLKLIGRKRAWAVHGTTVDGRGMDELSTLGPTEIAALEETGIRSFTVKPDDFGFAPATLGGLQGGDRETNARILLEVLNGNSGPRREVVEFNAAAGFVVAQITPNLSEGLELAREMIDSGKALTKLKALQSFQ